MQSCREYILEDIEVLPRKGNPGALKVDPEKGVESVLTSDEGHVVAAAATLGQGRIFVMTHAQYFGSFKEGEKNNESLVKLHDNVRKWVSNGKCHKTQGIKRIKNLTGEPKGEILIWHGGPIPDGAEEKVTKFVEAGGGLVHSVCPSGWLHRHQQQTLQDMPLAGLLRSAGIEHMTEVVRCNRNGFQVAQSCDPEVPKCGEKEQKEIRDEEHHNGSDRDEDEEQEQCDDHFEILEVEGEVPRPWRRYDSLVKTWRTELLKGVKWVPKMGVPGTCVAFGNQTVSFLSGSDPQNVIMAGGPLGKGRVFCLTHSNYLRKREEPAIKKLMRNMFEWVSDGAYRNDRDVLELERKNPDFKDKKILLWTGVMLDDGESERILDFVKDGGGLIHSTAPWGWLKLNPNRRLDEIPLTEILTQADIFYTKALCQNDGRYKVDLSDAACHTEAAKNIGYALSLAPNKRDLAKYGESLCLGLAPAPDAVKLSLAKDIQKVFDCHRSSAKNPSAKKPLTDPSQRCLVILCDQLCNMGHDGMRCIPCVDVFPGQCPPGPSICAERTATTNSTEKNFHSTGLYARPGAEIEVEITSPKRTLNDGWILRIGSHTDQIAKKDSWKRWPNLIKRRDLDESHVTLFSPYGGLIYLENRGYKKPRSITVRIDGVMEAAHYDLTDPKRRQKWRQCRDEPAPWVDLCGRYINFTMPRGSVQHLDDPGVALAVWDRVVEANCDLRGTDPADYRHQWVVCDVQPIAGYMHAGYPIVTMMDVSDPKASHKFLLNDESIVTEGRWGMFHELGHNMQRPWWTFKRTGEVTCNIFTLHAMDVIAHKEPWIIDWLAKYLHKMEVALKKDDPYPDWLSNPGIALGIYAQLQHCFGWGAYKAVFRHYEALPWDKRPSGDGNVITYWIETFSKTVGYNLCPLFEFWGFKLPDALQNRLTMRPFLPDDEMTRLAPHRVQVLKSVYPNLVRRVRVEACGCDDSEQQPSN